MFNLGRAIALAFTTVILGSMAVFAAGADDPTGTWLTQAGDAKVAVSHCGGNLCGQCDIHRHACEMKEENSDKPARPDGALFEK